MAFSPDGTRLATPYIDWEEAGPALDDRRTTLARLRAGEQFVYVFDFGDDWTHLCTVAAERIDPLDEFGILPDRPLPYWGWGDIPDQYRRRWDGNDGESPMPPDAALHGRRILVTRAAEQAPQAATLIRGRGGEPVLFPCLALECRPQAIRNAAGMLAGPSVDIAFTSANGVRCVARALSASERERLGHHLPHLDDIDAGPGPVGGGQRASAESVSPNERTRLARTSRPLSADASEGRPMTPDSVQAARPSVSRCSRSSGSSPPRRTCRQARRTVPVTSSGSTAAGRSRS